MRDKLYEIFTDKLVRVWQSSFQSSFHIQEIMTIGGFSHEEQREILQKWEDYLLDIGIKTQNWAEAVHKSKKDDIVVRNPCESDKPYMLVPKDLAIKIMVLGRLP